MSQLPWPGNEKALQCNGFFDGKFALHRSNDRRAGLPGLAARASQTTPGLPGRAARSGKPAG